MTLPAFPTPEAFLGMRPIRVVVIGAGGTGSQLLDGLASLDAALRAQGHAGIDATVYDHDHVTPSNVGRQRFTRSDVGLSKATLLVHRLNAFHGIDWQDMPCAFDPNDNSLGRADMVITCVDKGAFRADLGAAYRDRRCEILWLDCGNGASSAQAILSHLGKPSTGIRLPNVYDLYGGDALRAGDEDDVPSCSVAEALARQNFAINRAVATAAIALLDDLFHRGGLDYHGSFIRLTPLTVQPLRVCADTWASFGYSTGDASATGKTTEKKARTRA